MNNYDRILEDLQRDNTITNLDITLQNENESPNQQITSLLRQLRRAISRRNRVETLLNAWYIGEVIETKTSSLTERALCMKLLSPYYQKVIVRTYYIFEFLGTEQINRTRNTTLTMISRIGTVQYQNLLEEAMTIAGARL
jgi:hypothetical protein